MAVAGPHEATPLVSKRFSPPLVSTLKQGKQPPPVFTYKRSRQLLFSLFTISPRAVNFSFFFFGRFQALNINSLLTVLMSQHYTYSLFQDTLSNPAR